EIAALHDQQTATAEILRVIASSPTAAQRVLDEVVTSAARLLASDFVLLHRPEDDHLRTVAVHGPQAERFLRAVRQAGVAPRPVSRDGISGRALIDRQIVHVPDVAAVVETDFPATRSGFEVGGVRAQLAAPLLRGDDAIGVLSVLRFEPGPFTDDQV